MADSRKSLFVVNRDGPVLPTQTTEGQPAPALKFGQPRVTAQHPHRFPGASPPLHRAFSALDAATAALLKPDLPLELSDSFVQTSIPQDG